MGQLPVRCEHCTFYKEPDPMWLERRKSLERHVGAGVKSRGEDPASSVVLLSIKHGVREAHRGDCTLSPNWTKQYPTHYCGSWQSKDLA